MASWRRGPIRVRGTSQAKRQDQLSLRDRNPGCAQEQWVRSPAYRADLALSAGRTKEGSELERPVQRGLLRLTGAAVRHSQVGARAPDPVRVAGAVKEEPRAEQAQQALC